MPEVARSSGRVAVAVVGGVTMIMVVAVVAFGAAAGVGWQQSIDSYSLTNAIIGVALISSGAPVLWFTRNTVGTLLIASGLAHLTSATATMAALFGIDEGWPNPLIRTLSTLSTGAWQLGIPLLFPLALLLFPDGRLPSRRWLPVAWLIVLSGAFQALTGVLSDGTSFSDAAAHNSIVSIGLELSEPILIIAGNASGLAWLLPIASLVWRFVRGDERTKRQLMWLILAMVIITVVNGQRVVTGDGPILLLLSAVLIPVAMSIAIIRYALFDIRLVLSRTVLYGLTIAVIIAGYAGIVAGLSLLVSADAERAVAIAAAIVVAVVFTPLRLLLQRLTDRAFYGTRSDPAGTARQIGADLRHDDLPGVLEQTRGALRLPYLGLRSELDGQRLVASGVEESGMTVELPLSYRDDRLGTLVVGLRRGERQLHQADGRTLELIATPLAVALHAMMLGEEVRQARAATIEATAVERLRLQRELHDDVGPTLTSVAFRADAASNLVHADPAQAERLLDAVRTDLRGAIDDVRRVVYGLRPIELDEAGLLGAIRQKITALPVQADRQPTFEVDLPAELPELSPAVELAAYRIVGEGVANVLRHSDATCCRVAVAATGMLVVSVQDDGSPPESWSPGVGVRSITTRAEELGGTADIGPIDGGWQVLARLPLAGRSDVRVDSVRPRSDTLAQPRKPTQVGFGG